jgi:hypothetical protein
MEEGKTPHDSLIGVQQDDLTSTRPVCQGSQFE